MATENRPKRVEAGKQAGVTGGTIRGSLAVILVLAGLGAGVYWWWNRTESPPPEQNSHSAPVKPTAPPVELPRLPFSDITRSAGITFRHENGAAGEKLLPETMGGGCAFLDYDNNGTQDLLLINSARWPWDDRPNPQPATMELYQNDGWGNFQNVSEVSGLGVSFHGMGVACGDYDNDGDVDVFISAVGPNHLFRNLGNGKFEEVTHFAGVAGAETEWSTSSGWFDYDRDGDLDLFVANYIVWSRELDLSKNFTLQGGGRAYGRPQGFEGTVPYLYRNDGNGQFTEVGESAGLHLRDPRTGAAMAKSLGVAFADFDEDGWQDIIVANDTVRNFLFRNLGQGRFEEMGVLAGVAFDTKGEPRGAMGVDVGQFREDGSVGIAIGNFSNEMTALYVSRGGQMNFMDQAPSSGLNSTREDLTFGVFYFDADLDGRLDLFAANGHLEEDIQKVRPSQSYEQSPQLLWNSGATQAVEFFPLTEESTGKDLLKPMVGRGAAYADIDGDGDQDVLITASGRSPRLLRNDQNLGHHWVRFKLHSRRSNRDAIGAAITITLPDGRVLSQRVMPTRSYLSQVELPVTFGLGDANEISRVEILWPNGSRQTLKSLTADRLHEILQPAE